VIQTESPAPPGEAANADEELPRRAVVLLSGGLDSTLAVRLLLDQGIDVVAVNFVGPFCTCTPRSAGCKHMAKAVADELGVPIIVKKKGLDYLEMLEHPRHGYGRAMNPCIDCRIYMLRKVREMMPELGASFVATGEVLGQRPMSQRRDAMRIIDRESGLEDRILRPLSARHLEPTLPEREGLVDREALLSIRGRSRKEQLALAEASGVELFSCPAGGCVLTEPAIAPRLKDLFDHVPDRDLNDMHLLRVGRHFRLGPELKVILGRNESENQVLQQRRGGHECLEPVDAPGPTMLVRGRVGTQERQDLGRLILSYTRRPPPDGLTIRQLGSFAETTFRVREAHPDDRIEEWKI
jgi:hypothetical protein